MIRTFSDWQEQPVRGVEHLSMDTKTVPDMSLSVKDILTRFRRGTLDLESINRSYPNTDDDFDDDIMDGVEDMVDVFNLKQRIHGKVSEILHAGAGPAGGSGSDAQADSGPEKGPVESN